MVNNKVIMLAGQCESTYIIFNALKDTYHIEKIIIEEPVSKFQTLIRRSRKLGLRVTIGQVLFVLIIRPILNVISRKHILELKRNYKLDDTLPDKSRIIPVKSVNSPETISILKMINPSVVLINGTRIISKEVLSCIPSKFINMHAGITPLYRGVHGAYWALAENNPEYCGVTIHFVDSGIDTGNIIEQAKIPIAKKDNFVTYPFIQLAIGIPLLKKALNDVLENRVMIKSPPPGNSKNWSHPTIWGYLWYRFRYGIG